MNDRPAAAPPSPVVQAVASLQANQPERARALCRLALTLRPDDADALHVAGLSANRSGDAAQAHRHLRRALSVAPPDIAGIWRNLGGALRDGGDPAGAADAFIRALTLDPALAAAWSAVGLWRSRQDRRDNAARAHGRAARLDPNTAAHYANLALSLTVPLRQSPMLAACRLPPGAGAGARPARPRRHAVGLALLPGRHRRGAVRRTPARRPATPNDA